MVHRLRWREGGAVRELGDGGGLRLLAGGRRDGFPAHRPRAHRADQGGQGQGAGTGRRRGHRLLRGLFPRRLQRLPEAETLLSARGEVRRQRAHHPRPGRHGENLELPANLRLGRPLLHDRRQVRGCYYPIFPRRNIAKDELVVVCEGFATGAAIHQETGLPVVVAFFAGNIKPVADSLPFRNLVIAADNDKSGVGEKVSAASGYRYVMPDVVGWDFSDVFLELHFPGAYVISCRQAEQPPGRLRHDG